MTIKISNDEAKQDKLFYVVANIIIVNPADQTVLLLKRSLTEKALPGKWSFPGGKLEQADVAKLLEETGNEPISGIDNILGILAEREAKEECGLNVNAMDSEVILNKVFVRDDGIPVFMAVLAAKYIGGMVVLEEGAFTDFAWVAEADLGDYDTIDDMASEAVKALRLPLLEN